MHHRSKPHYQLFGILACAVSAFTLAPWCRATDVQASETPEAQQVPQACVSISSRERQFFAQVALLGREQIALGKLALRHGARPDVRKLAQQSINAYIRMAAQLTTLAEAKGVILPSDVTHAQAEAQTHLASLSGSAFDSAYLQMLVDSQQSLANLFAQQAQGPGDRQLTTWAQNAIPQLEAHTKRLASTQRAAGAARTAEDSL